MRRQPGASLTSPEGGDRILLLRFRVQGSGFRVQGSGFRVQGLGLKGLEFRVYASRV
jgi:hypothetical protein